MHSIVNADKLLVTKTTGILIQYNPAGSVIACSLNVTHSAECYTFSLKKMNRKKTHLQNQKRIYHNTHLPIEKYHIFPFVYTHSTVVMPMWILCITEVVSGQI